MLSWLKRLLKPKPADPPRTRLEGESLTDWEVGMTNAGRCPDCGGDDLLAGPRGGSAQNFKCANPACGSRFNDLMTGVERISDASPNRPPDPVETGPQPYR